MTEQLQIDQDSMPLEQQLKILKIMVLDCEQEIEDLNVYVDWASQGVMLLMALMNGRAAIAPDSAERKLYEEWRKRGHLREGVKSDGVKDGSGLCKVSAGE